MLITGITSPPLLTYPDLDQPFVLHVDASRKGLGAGLYQYKDKKVRILGYGSRALAKAEQKYHSSKLEFLSLKWAVCEQFRDYLTYARQIEVYTDNNPLLYLLSSEKLNATGKRWVNELADFNINIHYKPGRNNTDADALSRFPEDIKEYNKTYTNEVFSAVTDGIKTHECCNEAWLCGLNTNSNVLKEHEDQVLHQSTQALKAVNIKKHQDDNQAIKRVKAIILNNEQILAKDKVKEDPAVQRLLRQRKKLKVNSNNILVRSTEEIDQIVIPPSLKWLIYQEFHKNVPHLGAEISYHLARSRVYWPNMEEDIKFFIDNKCPCLASRKQRITAHAPLGTVTSTSPMDIIAIDFLKVDRAAGGYEYILVIIDQFTRYAQAYATTNKSAKIAAEKLFNDFVLKFGTPNRILHDQGKEFENKLFDELEKYFGIKRCRTTPYQRLNRKIEI